MQSPSPEEKLESSKKRPSLGMALLSRYGGAAIAFLALGALAYWGHQNDWKAPKFSELWGNAAIAEPEDWCEAHNVPDSKCLACHPELGGGDPKDWCKEHGVPESKCTVCHPEILTQGKANDWCREHGVPESQCTLCHPEIAVKGTPPDPEDGVTIAVAPGTTQPKNPLTCQSHEIRVQFASAAAVEKAGVKLEAVQERPMLANLTAAGEIVYDQRRVARLSAKVAGTVWRVEKAEGQPVRRGDVLALLDAGEVGKAKVDFLQSLAAVEQKRQLVERLGSLVKADGRLLTVKTEAHDRILISTQEGFRNQSDLKESEAAVAEARIRLAERQTSLQEAEAAVRAANIQLLSTQQILLNLGLPIRLQDVQGLSENDLAERVRFLGLPEALKGSMDSSTTTANLIPIIAPFDGIVVNREVVAGEGVDISSTLFVVADISQMWVMLNIRQEDASTVVLGQTVFFRPDGTPDGSVTGKLSWISTAVDEKTRTVMVRADVANPDGGLRAHCFGRGHIVIRESPTAAAVPTEAIHWEGCCHVVFVRLTDEIFQVRKVRLGTQSGPYTEIIVGVVPGEVVATQGSHVLKSEMLKSKLGAGCVDD